MALQGCPVAGGTQARPAVPCSRLQSLFHTYILLSPAVVPPSCPGPRTGWLTAQACPVWSHPVPTCHRGPGVFMPIRDDPSRMQALSLFSPGPPIGQAHADLRAFAPAMPAPGTCLGQLSPWLSPSPTSVVCPQASFRTSRRKLASLPPFSRTLLSVSS